MLLNGSDNGVITAAPFDFEGTIRAPRPELRFAVGDRVECNTWDGWLEGTVTRLWCISCTYRPEQQRKDVVHYPYEIELDESDDGEVHVAFYDIDQCIRAPAD